MPSLSSKSINNMKIGYHYTGVANWKKIQKYGLKRYSIAKEEFKQHGFYRVRGIWVWENELADLSEQGLIFLQMTKFGKQIVKLKFEYDEEDMYRHNGSFIRILHDGFFRINGVDTGLYYHKDEPARILTKPIAPEKIQLMGMISFQDLLKRLEDLKQDEILNLVKRHNWNFEIEYI